MEAIILAGGLGTRLRSVVSEVPKPMAPVGGRPFLTYVLDHLAGQGVVSVLIAVGYMREVIQNYFGHSYGGLAIRYCIEEGTLGTGGAIRQALCLVHGDSVFVLNGDTLFTVDLSLLERTHREYEADLTMAVRRVSHPDRYGTVDIVNGRITRFHDRRSSRSGTSILTEEYLINGGVYILHRGIFDGAELPEKFSFETDFLRNYVSARKFRVVLSEEYFIDIGVPDEYRRAHTELPPLFKQ